MDYHRNPLIRVLRFFKNLLFPGGRRYRKLFVGLCKGFWFPIDLHHEFRLYFGFYELELVPYVKSYTQPGSVCYDLGANNGYYALCLARMAGPKGKLYAFEPVSQYCEMMSETLAKNGMNEASSPCAPVQLFQYFIGNTVDKAAGQYSLDTLVYEEGLPMPDIIKMDVEGAEWDVFMGGQRVIEEGAPRLILEVHSQALEEQCLAFLTERGYRYTILDQSSWLPEHRPIQHNRWVCADKPR
jgi:hypothetical protein